MNSNLDMLNPDDFDVVTISSHKYEMEMGAFERTAFKAVQEYFGTESGATLILDSLFKSKRIIVESGGISYVCESSLFLFGNNYLFFVGNGLTFVVIQSNIIFHGVIFIDCRRVVVKKEPKKKSLEHVSLLYKYRHWIKKKILLTEDQQPAVINGYPRPYHDFYDRLPFLAKACAGKRVTLLNFNSFLDVSDFYGIAESNNDLDSYEELNLKYKLPVLLSAPLVSRSKKDHVRNEFAQTVACHITNSLFSRSSYDFCLWLGACDEKRTVSNVAALYDAVIRFLESLRLKAIVIVDGITAPDGKGVGLVEISARSIIGRESSLTFKSIANCDAKMKISIAKKVDFFISNALTDSIWCAYFNRKMGVCFSSNSSVLGARNHHFHFSTAFMPAEYIHDLSSTADPTRDEFGFVLDDASSFVCLAIYQSWLRMNASYSMWVVDDAGRRKYLTIFPIVSKRILVRLFFFERRIGQRADLYFIQSTDQMVDKVLAADGDVVVAPENAYCIGVEKKIFDEFYCYPSPL